MSEQTLLSIKDVCEKYDLSPVYVRRMILKGKIKTTKVQIAKNTYKHMMKVEEVERWRRTSKTRTQRTDGRNKFTIYCTKAEFTKLQKLLQENGLQTPLQRANPPKK